MSLHPASPNCLLTLALPSALEADITDALQALPDTVSGFSLLRGHGHGEHARLATAMEQVQGRANRVFVQLALHDQAVPGLLQLLRAALPNPEIAYWVVPLSQFGRFA